jgi:hypothetical protein
VKAWPRLLVCAAAALLAACASPTPRPAAPAPAPAPAAEANRPNVNLAGFPAEFRQGYSDGCATARGSRVRDETRFKTDVQYANGWRDGNDICSRRAGTAR